MNEPAPPQRLTVAYNGHAQARGALDMAAGLALAWHLPLELLVIHQGQDNQAAQAILSDAQAVLEAAGCQPASAQMSTGNPARVLVEASGPATLLVMGTHSHHTFLGFRRGHTVDDVLLGARGAVVLCPKEADTPGA